MNENSQIKTEPDSDEDERVNKLLNDPVVKMLCETLEKQGIKYKIIPLNLK